MSEQLYERICPICGDLIKYTNYNTHYMANRIKAKCKKCRNLERSKLKKNKSYIEQYGVEKAKILIEKNRVGHIGQKPTQKSLENLKRIWEQNKGVSRTKEVREKLSLANTGKVCSTETKEKISKSLTGRKGKTRSLAARQKLSICKKGRKLSVETKNKIREARKLQIMKPVSLETRKKMRNIAIKRVEESLKEGSQLTPFFNSKGCDVFDEISKKNNIFIQHAKNGGEYYIKELVYWVDGYDKQNNVVYEYDEKYHFTKKQKEKDERRQKEIEEYLGCTFVRIKDC